jgi:hypothetical protein
MNAMVMVVGKSQQISGPVITNSMYSLVASSQFKGPSGATLKEKSPVKPPGSLSDEMMAIMVSHR